MCSDNHCWRCGDPLPGTAEDRRALPYREQVFCETCRAVLAERDHHTEEWLRNVRAEMKSKQGVSAIIGKWPGDETDEEIEEALRGLRGG